MNNTSSSNSPDAPHLAQTMHTYYQQRAPEYDDWYDRRGRYDDPATNEQWHAEVQALGAYAANFGAGLTLDLACGTGRWTPFFAANAQVVGADYSPAMLQQTAARLAAADLSHRLSLVRVDAYALPFAADSFDRAFFGFWLSHVPLARVPEFFGGVARVLRPGGRMMIFDSLLTPDRAQRVEVQARPLKDGTQHQVLKVYYTPEQLAEALAPFGRVLRAEATGRYFVVAEIEIG